MSTTSSGNCAPDIGRLHKRSAAGTEARKDLFEAGGTLESVLMEHLDSPDVQTAVATIQSRVPQSAWAVIGFRTDLPRDIRANGTFDGAALIKAGIDITRQERTIDAMQQASEIKEEADEVITAVRALAQWTRTTLVDLASKLADVRQKDDIDPNVVLILKGNLADEDLRALTDSRAKSNGKPPAPVLRPRTPIIVRQANGTAPQVQTQAATPAPAQEPRPPMKPQPIPAPFQARPKLAFDFRCLHLE